MPRNASLGGPPARRNHGLAFDPGTARTVLFGGEGASAQTGPGRDTWQWDGMAWQRVYFSADGGSTCNGARCVWPRAGAHWNFSRCSSRLRKR